MTDTFLHTKRKVKEMTIDEAIKKTGMSKTEVAAAIKVSYNTLINYAVGRTDIPAVKLRQLAKLAGVDERDITL